MSPGSFEPSGASMRNPVLDGRTMILPVKHWGALSTNFAPSATGLSRSVVFPVVEGQTWKLTRNILSSRFGVVFLAKEPEIAPVPFFGGIAVTSGASEGPWQRTVTVPANATFMAVYLSNTGEDNAQVTALLLAPPSNCEPLSLWVLAC